MSDSPDSSARFEDKLSRLEKIVESLEDDMPPLEDALTAYEEGVRLADACLEQLREAEQRVEEISLTP